MNMLSEYGMLGILIAAQFIIIVFLFGRVRCLKSQLEKSLSYSVKEKKTFKTFLHNFNNPLSSVIGLTQMMIEDINDKHVFYNMLKTVEKEALRCKKEIADYCESRSCAKENRENGEAHHGS